MRIPDIDIIVSQNFDLPTFRLLSNCLKKQCRRMQNNAFRLSDPSPTVRSDSNLQKWQFGLSGSDQKLPQSGSGFESCSSLPVMSFSTRPSYCQLRNRQGVIERIVVLGFDSRSKHLFFSKLYNKILTDFVN